MQYYCSAIPQAADELREQEARQKNDEIQQKSAQLEQTQVLNSVLMQVGCVPLPIHPSSLPNKTTICMTVVLNSAHPKTTIIQYNNNYT